MGNVGGAIMAHTELVARKLELTPFGQALVASGRDAKEIYARPLEDGLWRYSEDERRVVKDKCVTDVFCEDIVNTLQSSVAAFSNFKYHHSGEGVGAEAAGDTALGTPRESARVVGTQVDGASAKEYKSVATITYTGSYAITEHGLFNTAGAGGPPVVGGDLMDRTKFAAINVTNGMAVEFSFTISFTSGG